LFYAILEPLNTITPVENSEVELRHYTLKRTNSYNGLGIIISADIDTHLNHRIRDIEIGSPGSRVGLHKNDRIIKVNGINVENTPFDDVLLLIKQGLKNNNLQFSVLNESGYL
jgi:C-terminal processing protease CtpA/Prc